MLSTIKELFIIDNSYKTSKITLLLTIIGSFLTYNLLIINGYTNADGVIEGLTYYNNAYVASAMSGRWLIRYIQFLTAGIVNPFLIVTIYSICVFLSVLLLKKVFIKMSNTTMYLSSLLLIINSVVITQLTYLYMGIAFAFAQLFACLFLYINVKYKKWYLLASIPLALSLGLYQSYIGMAAVLCLMYLIYKLIEDKETINDLLKLGLRFILSALLGVIIYFILMNIDRMIFSVDDYDRISSFSLESILTNIGTTFINAYKSYFKIYLDAVLKRRYLFGGLLICLLVTLFIHLKNKKIINICLSLLFILLIPLFSNIVSVLIPDNPIYIVMEYQVFLLVPFILILIDMLNINYLKIVSSILTGLVIWTYVLGGNATYKCYELSYRHINSQYQMILNDIYNTEGYVKDETPIIIAGFVDDYELKRNNYLYHYTIEFPENPAFWLDFNGVTYNRFEYFMNYFGVNPRQITVDEYNEVVHSDFFKSMPIWPNENSIVYHNGVIIVKLTDDIIR